MRVAYRQHLRQNAQYNAEIREARLLLKEMGEGARFGERTIAQAKAQLRRKRQERSKRLSHRAKQ